jgi:hypothetical protein
VIARRFRRSFAATLLAATTVVTAALPPAHVHVAAPDDHHHHHGGAIEHSHWSSHGVSRASFDDDDGRAIYVDHPAVQSRFGATIARPTPAVVALLLLPVPAPFTIVERQTSGNSPRDGPAVVSPNFRAPPFVL